MKSAFIIFAAVAGIASASALAAPDDIAGLEQIGNPGDWITTQDYPVFAALNGKTGAASFTLIVDRDGKPERCQITGSSGDKDLDAKTCELLLARARFRPGKNASGKPVGGTYSNTVRWALPHLREGSEVNTKITNVEISPNGVYDKCEMVLVTGVWVGGRDDCADTAGRTYQHNTGRRLRAQIKTTITFGAVDDEPGKLGKR